MQVFIKLSSGDFMLTEIDTFQDKLKKPLINYKTHGDPKGDCLLLLSPGVRDSRYWDRYVDLLPGKYRIIAPDYPGRGGSLNVQPQRTITDIADHINILLENLNVGNVTIFAQCFGTMIAIEMLRNSAFTRDIVKKVVLITPGDYVKPIFRKIFIPLFTPTTKSKKIRTVYCHALRKWAILKKLKQEEALALNYQWLSVLHYKTPSDFCFDKPTLIIRSKHDYIVDPASYNNIYAIFPNSETTMVNEPHILPKEDVRRIIVEIVNPFLLS
jgi:pimeloyl-ACP methyl ester carboxylesterase